MPYTYPAVQPTLTGDVTTINRFLKEPTLVARRLRDLLEQRYIADYLLTGRYVVEGGSVMYETGESIFTDRQPRAVTPGGEYSLTTLGNGVASLAKTVNWGQDAFVTDPAISRLKFDPVSRAFTKLANQNVAFVDSIAMAAITSGVTNSTPAAAPWATATATQILTDVGLAKAQIKTQNQGYDPDTVVIDDINWTHAMIKFIAAGYVPRETSTDNPALTGDFPEILGMKWLATPNGIAGNAVVLDHTQLGGMADENLGGPGYVSAAGPNTAAVQVKTMRDDERDRWRLRARRVTVPVVVEPAAARKITGI